MPIKLQVEREGDEGKDPADYLFEQERIQLGRASDNDLTLPDQEISQHHAEVVHEGGEYKLRDLGSKNHTFVHGRKLEDDESHTLKSGDVFAMGSFRIEFIPLFMPSSEQTVLADDDTPANPFERHARELKQALTGLAETYTYAPSEIRDDEFKRTLKDVLGARSRGKKLEEHEVVRQLARFVHDAEPSNADSLDEPSGAPTTKNGTGKNGTGAAEAGTTDTKDGLPQHVDAVLDVLVEAVARMTSIPRKFWREFSGDTVVHPPKESFLRTSDLDSLRAHLLDKSISAEERSKRLSHLKESVDTLVWHEVSLLNGYKAAVKDGSQTLLRELNPESLTTSSSEGGFFTMFGGGGSVDRTAVKDLYNRWKKLREQSLGALEESVYRPAFTEAYLDRMADSWGVEKTEIATERDEASSS
jgi:pSer/pThr/pTyr-binding forkhead associated (FHA) protein